MNSSTTAELEVLVYKAPADIVELLNHITITVKS